MTQVWAWVLPILPGTAAYEDGEVVYAELFFSSKEKFLELLGREFDPETEAIIKVSIDDKFEYDVDFIPENY